MVDLGNSVPTVNNGLYGISVAAVGFKNGVTNIRASEEEPYGPTFIIRRTHDATVYEQTFRVAPGQYTITTLCQYLEDVFTGPDPVQPTINTAWEDTIAAPGIQDTVLHCSIEIMQDGSQRIKFYFEDTVGGPIEPIGIAILGCPDTSNSGETPFTAANYFGWSIDPTIKEVRVIASGDENVIIADNLTTLAGESALFLHSSAVAKGRETLDGEGLTNAMVQAIPITVPFGVNQTFTNQNGEARPSIIYDELTSIRQINIQLRDVRGRAVDIGGGELWVVFRFWS